jgi:hypothetical protein
MQVLSDVHSLLQANLLQLLPDLPASYVPCPLIHLPLLLLLLQERLYPLFQLPGCFSSTRHCCCLAS